jgi:hypothetical protein
MTKPYFDENNEPCLEESVIVYADMLGYKELLRKSHRDGKESTILVELHGAMSRAFDEVRDPSGEKWYVKLFSDNLFVGYRFLGGGKGVFEFAQACHSIGHFQRELAISGYFIRGGISVGAVHASELMIFGNILNELIKADSKGNPPRIALLDSAMTFLKRNPSIELHDISRIESEVRFINYLLPLGSKCDKLRRDQICLHKHQIERNLARFKNHGKYRSTYQKYLWCARYHNAFCKESKYLSDASFHVVI